tara:strand:+ start:53630 stop:53794 length:165 start_codon:yes stop_codon:yes gene_type:complete
LAARHPAILWTKRKDGKAPQPFIESLNSKFRAECLNANWFLSLDEARSKTRGLA